MGINADSKGSTAGSRPVADNSLQQTPSNQSKATEAGELHQRQNIMATIADDDDRLLVRIGYTPVSIS
jgi:3-deoxy-D-arabino-heptulosonate 7-phosphate (DAHP) synthase